MDHVMQVANQYHNKNIIPVIRTIQLSVQETTVLYSYVIQRQLIQQSVDMQLYFFLYRPHCLVIQTQLIGVEVLQWMDWWIAQNRPNISSRYDINMLFRMQYKKAAKTKPLLSYMIHLYIPLAYCHVTFMYTWQPCICITLLMLLTNNDKQLNNIENDTNTL